jgi:hypothetical protein
MTLPETQICSMRELAGFVADLFRAAGSVMNEACDAKGRLFALAQTLGNLQPRLTALEPGATAVLTDRLSQAAARASAALAQIESGCNGRDANDAVLALAAGANDLGDALRVGVNSLAPSRSDGQDLALPQVQQPVAFVASELMLSADALLHSLGLGYLGRASFSIGGSEGCGCGAGDGGPAARIAAGTLSGDVLKLDRYDLDVALKGLSGVVERLAESLRHLGLYFQKFPQAFVINCGNLCPVVGRRIRGPRIRRFFAANNGTTWVPGFDLDWTVCCTCLCALVFRQRRLLPITTTHTVTGTNIPNTRPIGIALIAAATAARAELAGFGFPGFLANPAIAPAVAIPLCPAPGTC